MLAALKGLGIAGGIGFLIGVGLVASIKPTENGGVGVLLFLPTLICAIIGGIIGKLTGKKPEGDSEDNKNNDNEGGDAGD